MWHLLSLSLPQHAFAQRGGVEPHGDATRNETCRATALDARAGA
jgi:hypothetical protein